MAIISESEMLDMVRGRNVLLVDPGKRKYIPLGLAKLARFIHSSGGTWQYQEWSVWDSVPSPDVIAITTLFTFEQADVAQVISSLREQHLQILAGGIAATLIPKH